MSEEPVINDLKDSIFSIVFQDGTAKMLSLPELMAFTFNIIVLSRELPQLEKMVEVAKPSGPTKIKLSFQFAMQHIMTPEMVKMLLSKIEFSDTPSDA